MLFTASWRVSNCSVRAAIRRLGIIKKSMIEKNDRRAGFSENLTYNPGVRFCQSCPGDVTLPSAAVRRAWEAFKAASRHSVSWVTTQ